MVERARARAVAAGAASVEFEVGDVRSYRGGRRYDVVLLMFAVLGYQLEDEDVDATFRTVAAHLEPGGVLIFDVWNGPAVLSIGPTPRSKSVPAGEAILRRTARGTLDLPSRTCTVDYLLEWLHGDRLIRTATEQHHMRYFFRDELSERMQRAGLTLVQAGSFPDVQRPAGSDDWNALYVARLHAL
jgi:hypothetical protein